MIPIVNSNQVAIFDNELAKTHGVDAIINRVGFSVARRIEKRFGGSLYGRRIVVLAGPGNNGKDGLAAAKHLIGLGAKVRIFDFAELIERNLDLSDLREVDLVVDAIFGSGLSRDFNPPRLPKGLPILAIDILSGLDSDSGLRRGGSLVALETVVIGALKPGHIQNDGMRISGQISLVLRDIYGGSNEIFKSQNEPECHLFEETDLKDLIPVGSHEGHKWRRAVMVVAGSDSMAGSATMVASGIQQAGSGMVVLHTEAKSLQQLPSQYVVRSIERMWAPPLLDQLPRFGAAVIGPGIGESLQISNMVRRFVAGADRPVVIDADGIKAFTSASQLKASVVANRRPVVITPHIGEFNYLGKPDGIKVAEDSDLVAAVRTMAKATSAIVMLKGSPTVVADPGGRVVVVAEGNSLLAFAGSGDVLSGIVGSFLSAGMDPVDAAAAAAFVHARAARLSGGFSTSPEGLIREVPRAIEGLNQKWHLDQSAYRII